MVRDKKLLIGVDDSDASRRSISYVADMMRARDDFHIVLFHVLPPIPPELLEFGGAEDPGTEQKLDEALKHKQAQWVENAKKAAEPIVDHARIILHRTGISPEATTTVFSQSIHRPDVVRELIETAHTQNCGTIVVGRETYSIFKEIFHHHVGEELVRQAHGVAIWVIA
jgi:nucleotide-binding universal stress UspA family protein